jgi:hypothetical protein
LIEFAPPRQLNRYPPPLFDNWQKQDLLLLVHVTAPRATRTLMINRPDQVARYNLGCMVGVDPLGRLDNKSLNRSGVSGPDVRKT